MDRKFAICLLALVMALALTLAGCSAEYKTTDDSYSSPGWTEEYGYGGQPDVANNSKNASAAAPAKIGQKLIRTAQVTAKTTEYDQTRQTIDQKLAALEGYVAQSEERNESDYYEARCVTLLLRVPNDRLEDLLAAVDAAATVTERTVTTADVTSEYTDVQSRITALESEQKALLALLEQAESLSDVLEVQDRLTEVNAQLDSYKGQKQYLDDQVTYSSVQLTLYEVQRIPVEQEQGFFAQVGDRIAESLQDIGRGLKSFGVWFLGGILYWLLLAAVIVIVLLIVRRARKRHARKQQALQARWLAMQAAAEQPQAPAEPSQTPPANEQTPQ